MDPEIIRKQNFLLPSLVLLRLCLHVLYYAPRIGYPCRLSMLILLASLWVNPGVIRKISHAF